MRSVRLLLIATMLLAGAAPAARAQSDAAAPESSPTDSVATAAIGLRGPYSGAATLEADLGIRLGIAGAGALVTVGPGGIGAGAYLRAYPPIPRLEVPAYATAGASVHGDAVRPWIGAGVHVPIADEWRLDLEAGVGVRVTSGAWAVEPRVSVGVSWAVPVGADALAPTTRTASLAARRGRSDSSSCGDAPPDASDLHAAVDSAIRGFVADAWAIYGFRYRDLDYAWSIASLALDGDEAHVEIAWSASVIEILTSDVIAGDGTAAGSFVWDGCAWELTGTDY